MTIPACRKAVFGLLVMTLFSSLLTEVTADVIACDDLKSPTMGDFLSCKNPKMRIKAENGVYPIADFSKFSQENFTKAMTSKNEQGRADNDYKRLFCGNFLAKDSKLTSISIGFYVENEDISQSLVLEDNWNLMDVNIAATSFTYNITMTFTIRNNKMLSPASIAHLKNISYILPSSYIQEHGECDFHGVALTALDHLEYCKYIVGDLIIDSSTITKITKTIDFTKLNGCLRIKESNIDNIDFLKNVEVGSCAKHEILENENLCINPEQVSDLKKKLNNVLTYKDKGNCVGVCSSKYFMENKEKDCVIIEGNLKISKEHEGDLSFLKEIQQIRGRLIIHSTNFSNVDFFPKLKIVNDSASEDKEGFGTIEIMYNAQLDNVSFPALENIIVGKENKKKIYIKENGGNHLSDGVRSYFEDKFGKDSVTISVPKPPAPPPRTAQQIEEEAAEEERKKKAEKEELSDTGKILIGVSIITVLVAACGAAVGYCFYRGFRRRKEWIKNERKFLLKIPIDLEVPLFITVKYIQQLPWMKEAEEIIAKNVKKIAEHAKELDSKVRLDWRVVFYKNDEAVSPIFSRNDSVLSETGCGLEKSCECDDFGVRNNNGYAFGVRMEKATEKWKKKEKERNHYSHAETVPLPVIYEENSNSTLEKMKRRSQMVLDEVEEWDKEFKCHKTMKITSRGISLKKKQEDVDKANEDKWKGGPKSVKRCSTLYYRTTIHTMEGEPELDAFESLPVTQKSPPFWRHLTWYSKTNTTNYFYDNMIYSHMNAPSGKWVTNYTAQNFIDLCKDTLEAIEDTSKDVMHATVENVNVRIIGQLLGDFESLRKGLSHPSVNAIEGVHPICNVTHIFLGNLVGPKCFNLNVLCLLFALKCRYKKNYVFLRGALEWNEMGDISGLKKEIVSHFQDKAIDVFDAVMEVFNRLPFTCKVGENLLCTHSGVAPRMKEVLSTKLPITDLVPDTLAFNMMFAQPNYTVKRFFDNVEQGAGYYFGNEAMDDVLLSFGTRKDEERIGACTGLICTKSVSSGYSVFGQSDCVMYTICGTNVPGGRTAQIEFDAKGLMHMQVIYQ